MTRILLSNICSRVYESGALFPKQRISLSQEGRCGEGSASCPIGCGILQAPEKLSWSVRLLVNLSGSILQTSWKVEFVGSCSECCASWGGGQVLRTNCACRRVIIPRTMDRQLLMPNHPSELRTMRPTDCLCALRCIRPVVLGVVLFVLTTIGVFVVLVSSPATVSTTLALFPTVRQSGLHSARIPRPLPGVGQRTARHVHTPALRDIEAPVAKLPQEANPQSFIGHSRTHVPLPAPWSFSLGLGLLLLLSAPLLLMRARFCTRTRYPDIALMAVTGESYSSVRRPLSMQQRATHSGLCCAVGV